MNPSRVHRMERSSLVANNSQSNDRERAGLMSLSPRKMINGLGWSRDGFSATRRINFGRESSMSLVRLISCLPWWQKAKRRALCRRSRRLSSSSQGLADGSDFNETRDHCMRQQFPFLLPHSPRFNERKKSPRGGHRAV